MNVLTFSRAWGTGLFLLLLFLIWGDGHHEPVLSYKGIKLLLQLIFFCGDVIKQMWFFCPHVLYIFTQLKRKTALAATKGTNRRKRPCRGLCQASCFLPHLFNPSPQFQTGLNGLRIPLQCPSPWPCPPRQAIRPTSSLVDSKSFISPVSAERFTPRSRETGACVFSFINTEKNGHFLRITNVYITFKLQVKNCVLFILISFLEEDTESNFCKFARNLQVKEKPFIKDSGWQGLK